MTSAVTPQADRDAVAATVHDYFDSWFAGDAERMRRALHPELAKRGMLRGDLETDTAESMVAATAEGFGTRYEPARRGYRVDVVHVHGDIATATAVGGVYVEYLHLVRVDGRWQIVNALWAHAADVDTT